MSSINTFKTYLASQSPWFWVGSYHTIRPLPINDMSDRANTSIPSCTTQEIRSCRCAHHHAPSASGLPLPRRCNAPPSTNHRGARAITSSHPSSSNHPPSHTSHHRGAHAPSCSHRVIAMKIDESLCCNEYFWVEETFHSSCYRLRIVWKLASIVEREARKGETAAQSRRRAAAPATKRQEITPVVQSTQSPLLDTQSEILRKVYSFLFLKEALPLGQLLISLNTSVSSSQTVSSPQTCFRPWEELHSLSELVGLSYKHKSAFFVTLWMSKICEQCFVTRFCYRAFFMISNKISWKITSLYRKPTMAIKRYLSYSMTDAVKWAWSNVVGKTLLKQLLHWSGTIKTCKEGYSKVWWLQETNLVSSLYYLQWLPHWQ